MSTLIYQDVGTHQISLTQYYGGDDRGVCIQITGNNCDRKIGHVGMDVKEARLVVKKLKKWLRRL